MNLRLRLPLLLIALTALPLFAAIAPEVTIPVGGNLKLPNDLVYRSEITITNHRDAQQIVKVEVIHDGVATPVSMITLGANETRFISRGLLRNDNEFLLGALRFTAADRTSSSDPYASIVDPLGKIEVNSTIVADRGRFASRGSTRQEMPGVPSTEYLAPEAVFVGVQHTTYLYTNVGIVNLDPEQDMTFFVEFQFHDPVAVTVPPMTLSQIRIAQPEQGGRYVRVYPEWATYTDISAGKTPWVAYTSTIDTITGDAYTAARVPSDSTFEP